MAVDAHGMPIRVIVTKGITADCAQGEGFIADIKAQHSLADKWYDSNKIIKRAQDQGMEPVILPRKNRKVQKPYDVDLYKLRHIIENTFWRLKDRRGIATRYAQNVNSFIAAVQIRCLMLWLKIS
jgi:transposase